MTKNVSRSMRSLGNLMRGKDVATSEREYQEKKHKKQMGKLMKQKEAMKLGINPKKISTPNTPEAEAIYDLYKEERAEKEKKLNEEADAIVSAVIDEVGLKKSAALNLPAVPTHVPAPKKESVLKKGGSKKRTTRKKRRALPLRGGGWNPSVFDILLKEEKEKEDVSRLQKLIDDDADVDEYKKIDGEEHTPISYLIEYGNDYTDDNIELDMMEILLKAGASTDLERVGLDKDYEALCECIRNRQYRFAKKLLEHGHDPNAFDKDFMDVGGRFTSLMLAIEKLHKETVSLLLEKGADPNNNKGFKVPFDVLLDDDHADYEEEKDLMERVLEDVKNGDDIDENPDIMNALDFYHARFPTVSGGHGQAAKDILRMLQRHGAKTTKKILGYDMEEWTREYEQEANTSRGVSLDDEQYFVQDTSHVVERYLQANAQEEAIAQFDGDIPRVLLDTDNFRDVYFEEHEAMAYLQESNDHILIVDGQQLVGTTRTLVQHVMQDATKILLECDIEDVTWGDLDLYVKMDSIGILTGAMVKVNQIKHLLSSDQQIFVIDTTRDEKRERLVQSLAAHVGISLIGAKHCQEKEPIRIGTLYYVDREMWLKAKGQVTQGSVTKGSNTQGSVPKGSNTQGGKKRKSVKKGKKGKKGTKALKKKVQKTKKRRRT